MENSFQTSFIPKKTPVAKSASHGGEHTNLFTVLAVIVLVIVGGLAGGLYLYKNYLIEQKETLSASLKEIRDSFEQDTISELSLYDKRVKTVRTILDTHIVTSPLFSLVGSLTIPSIQFTKFEHSSLDKSYTVKMSGLAKDYPSIALQSDVFNSAKGKYFKDAVFSNLVKDKNNAVSFNVDFTVDPTLLSYQKSMSTENQLPARVIAPPTNAVDVETPQETPNDAQTTGTTDQTTQSTRTVNKPL